MDRGSDPTFRIISKEAEMKMVFGSGVGLQSYTQSCQKITVITRMEDAPRKRLTPLFCIGDTTWSKI